MIPTIEDLRASTPIGANFYLGGSREYELDYSLQHLRRFREIAGLVADLSFPPGSRLLDIGTNPFTFYLKKKTSFDVCTVDYRDGFAERCAAAGITFRQHDLTAQHLPYAEQSFDVIVMTEVFEHLIVDPVRILRKLKTMLKRPGFLVFGTPNLASLQNRLLLLAGQPILDWPTWELPEDSIHGHGHNRIYCFKELKAYFEKAEFPIRSVSYSDCLDRPDHWDNAGVRLAKWCLMPAKLIVPSFRWGIHIVAENA